MFLSSCSCSSQKTDLGGLFRTYKNHVFTVLPGSFWVKICIPKAKQMVVGMVCFQSIRRILQGDTSAIYLPAEFGEGEIGYFLDICRDSIRLSARFILGDVRKF